MAYRFIADLVLAGHFAFVLFVTLGGLLVLRWRRAAWPHLAAFAWGVLAQLANLTCPLTPLENYFRRMGGEAGYAGGFVEHYVSAVLYPEGITHELRASLGVLLIAVNVAVYCVVLFRLRRGARLEGAAG